MLYLKNYCSLYLNLTHAYVHVWHLILRIITLLYLKNYCAVYLNLTSAYVHVWRLILRISIPITIDWTQREIASTTPNFHQFLSLIIFFFSHFVFFAKIIYKLILYNLTMRSCAYFVGFGMAMEIVLNGDV